MLSKKSRYQNTPLFSPLEDGSNVFQGLRARTIGPSNAVVEHEVESSNRLDQLATHYYNQDRLWWRIADANPQFVYAPNMLGTEMQGSAILIPKAKE
ncbi:hypothetical protein P2G88_03725 [Aliiglaciecola sp. CAU 1673]|uniref:hypothetical protein n=1 Tax=Aliiglaciecola sp. CAU 1673 TaxID=3032595 RepID=UPI0023D9E60D|nr:hypothetical protein [Aliiglaciecola sp. CAU 1673]MDF2177353.1 hypothetical protein [Aliiglaciecola sp. CAU 1673]